MTHRRYSPRLGDTATTAVAEGSKIASAGLSAVAAASSAGLLSLGAAAAAIPVAGAVIAVGTLIFSLLHNSRGLQQDTETTAIVDKAMAYMSQNLQAWNASNKSLSTQAQALMNFDQAWQAVVNFCSQASEGSPGQRCISERQRGGKYDYFAAYRDPIANDPQAGLVDKAAAEAAATAAGAAAPTVAVSNTAAASGSWSPLAIAAALAAAVLVLK